MAFSAAVKYIVLHYLQLHLLLTFLFGYIVLYNCHNADTVLSSCLLCVVLSLRFG